MEKTAKYDKMKRHDISLARNKIWSSRTIASALFGSQTGASLKKTERWVVEKELNFSLLNKAKIVDEHERHAKVEVINQLTDKARKKRKSVLFAAIYSYGPRLVVFFVNDGRNGRRWIFFNVAKFTDIHLQKALELLSSSENKDVVILPSGPLVSICRLLSRKWTRNQIQLSNSCKLHIALEVYSHSFGDIGMQVERGVLQTSTAKTTHLDYLEAEAIYVMREAVAESIKPVMLYSVGKDSQVMLHLARKAFYPSAPPFPLLHIDTRWKFQEMYDFRDYVAKNSGMDLLIHINPDGVEKGINPFDHGSELHTSIMKTQSLKQALDHHRYDVAFGGARRDEEKSRSKERICSFRTNTHLWDPKKQRPELWNQYNLLKNRDETIRVFPISNWTELDIWQYIYREQIPVVPLYFAAERPVVERDGMLIMVDDDRFKFFADDDIQIKKIRFRTLGCYPLTGAIESDSENLPSIILELLTTKMSERVGRVIDGDVLSSMERKKWEGYF